MGLMGSNGIFMGFTLWLCQNSELENMDIKLVDLPSEMVICHRYVKLPEGKQTHQTNLINKLSN